MTRTIAITGASGLVGQALTRWLRDNGDRVIEMVRRIPAGPDEAQWDPERGYVDGSALDGVTAVVHLAGANVSARRWDEAFKRTIRQSRVQGTRALVQALNALSNPPEVLISASGVGYYGDTGDRIVDETAPAGDTFLAEVCQEWEAEARAVNDAIRSVQVRIGMVLSRDGGALEKMIAPFSWGLGGKLGSGEQYVSWISLPDLVRALVHCITRSPLHGPVNGVGPRPVRNVEFTNTLGRVLHRPAVVPVPKLALRLVLGELAEEALSGQRAVPRALESSGFEFQHPNLEAALRSVLGR